LWAFTIAAVNADDHEAIQKLVELSYAVTEENTPDLHFELNNAVMYTLGNFNEIIEVLAQVFMWVGLGLALFSAFLLMNFINSSGCDAGMALGVGLFGGLAIGLSALFQGKCAAASADALGATGKGTANYFIVIGIAETVALFTLVFCLLLLNS
jgi:F0F1-type ATP synthase membrane subunit c/vacuolar-type H+-ATPase subunit K